MIKPSVIRTAAAAVLAVTVSAAIGLAPGPLGSVAHAQSGARSPGAEQYVQVNAQRALDILSQHGGDQATEKRLFRGFIDQVADVPKITTFVLGKYARTATPAQRQAFATVFREYAANVYESRLSDYHGETMKVTGSVARSPTDIIVASQVSGGKLDHPVAVSWRVLGESGGWRVVDVQVAGVWLAITEQQDFVSTIDNAGGNVDVLIAQLQKQVAREQAQR
jgi:phospholipid transport system substrate-binding protein